MEFTSEINSKLLNPQNLNKLIQNWRNQNNKIVFTNGCFDLLHPGHIDYLAKARHLGDRLIIGLNSDESVSKLKGPKRPVNNEKERAILLASMSFIDAVIIFSEDTPLRLISEIIPDVLVKGGDYSIDTVVGADIVENHGGKVIILPFLEGYSSSNMINKILKSYE